MALVGVEPETLVSEPGFRFVMDCIGAVRV